MLQRTQTPNKPCTRSLSKFSIGLIAILTFLFSLIANTKTSLQSETSSSALEAVKKLTAEIDLYVKENPKPGYKFLARMNPVDHSQPVDSWEWKKVDSEEEEESYFKGYWSFQKARVWVKNSNVIYVATTEWSDSGDWAILIGYYFDDIGQLLLAKTDYRTAIDDIKVLDFQYFDRDGQVLGHYVDYFRLALEGENKLPAKPENMQTPLHDNDIPIYLKSSALPFYALIILGTHAIN